MTIRRKPYTEAGILRVPCARCGQRAYAQWNVCADGGAYRAICRTCDIDLNRIVLNWVRDPRAESKLAAYIAKQSAT